MTDPVASSAHSPLAEPVTRPKPSPRGSLPAVPFGALVAEAPARPDAPMAAPARPAIAKRDEVAKPESKAEPCEGGHERPDPIAAAMTDEEDRSRDSMQSPVVDRAPPGETAHPPPVIDEAGMPETVGSAPVQLAGLPPLGTMADIAGEIVVPDAALPGQAPAVAPVPAITPAAAIAAAPAMAPALAGPDMVLPAPAALPANGIAILAASPGPGEMPKDAKAQASALAIPAEWAADGAEAPANAKAPALSFPPAKGAADLVTLLAGRDDEGAIPKSAPETGAQEAAKPAFARWIEDFALAQGAIHRSGDLVGSLDRAVAGLPTPHAGQDALRPTPLPMLPIEIGMQAMRGVKTFQIRLDPAELGRVEVKLEIREDGEVKTNLVVDRVETLAMLKRDATTLQQAFEQAGLRQSADGLQFQLRGEQQGRDNPGRNAPDGEPGWPGDADEAGLPRPAEIVTRRVMIPHSSLDLVI